MIQKEIIDSLKKLKGYYGVIAIKAEFEAEGSRKDELIMLREFVDSAELGFIIKIGGCEAVHDMDQCKLLGATGVMAPMIETGFAMSKFKSAFIRVFGENSSVERIINAETITCLENFEDILSKGEGFLTGVTVGRGDLSGSMGVSRDQIEGEEILRATKKFAVMSRKKGLITNFGGNIGTESVPFINEMLPYIDRVETRKVVAQPHLDNETLKEEIIEALRFEWLYLKFKAAYYDNMAGEDTARIARIERQLQDATA